MKIEQFKLDKYEFKFQPPTAVQYWNVSCLLGADVIRNFEMLSQLLCDKNVKIGRAHV